MSNNRETPPDLTPDEDRDHRKVVRRLKGMVAFWWLRDRLGKFFRSQWSKVWAAVAVVVPFLFAFGLTGMVISKVWDFGCWLTGWILYPMSFYGITGDEKVLGIPFALKEWMPAVVLILIIVGLWFIGRALSHSLVSRVKDLVASLIERIPLVGSLYKAAKQVFDSFDFSSGENKTKKIVWVEYPSAGLWVPGFETLRVGKWCLAYLPTAPNPTSGFTPAIRTARVIESSATFEELMQYIFSCAIVVPKVIQEELSTLPKPENEILADKIEHLEQELTQLREHAVDTNLMLIALLRKNGLDPEDQERSGEL